MIRIEDLAASDRQRAAALDRFRVEVAEDPPALDRVLRPLELEFAAKGEIEARPVLERWHAKGSFEFGGWRLRYRAVAFLDGAELAAVRDCFIAVRDGAAVVLLSHSLVLPPWRRSGVAALARAVPLPLARQEGAEEVDLVAEMELYQPEEDASVRRFSSYFQAGFRAIPPAAVPYAQPDFSEPEAQGRPARPIPMALVVRRTRGGAELSAAEARFMLDGLHVIHRQHVDERQLASTYGWANRAIPPRVPLLGQAELTELERSVNLAFYPEAWR